VGVRVRIFNYLLFIYLFIFILEMDLEKTISIESATTKDPPSLSSRLPRDICLEAMRPSHGGEIKVEKKQIQLKNKI
jgi:hypothetical protein